jgi:uncharacterized repeat protein (TIGR01451 family)
MKRTLVGLSVLMGLVGGGSAGLYYARPMLLTKLGWASQPPAETAPEPEMPAEAALSPVPLSAPSDAQGTTTNPFARAAAPQVTTPPANVDRYGNPASLTLTSGQQQLTDDIPDASELGTTVEDRATEVPATRTDSPFVASRRGSARYEEPASSDAPVEEEQTTDTATEPAAIEPEPRRLEPRESDDDGARYREPLSARRSGRATAQEPTEELAEEPDTPQTEPASDPPAEESGGDELGTGRPGDPQLSGAQAPTLTIEKSAPPEIQIGQAAKFVIKVRNVGTASAQGVEIHDVVPQGTQLIDTNPSAKRGPQGELIWSLGNLKPGSEQTVELQLMPMSEGEIGSVATVHFRAEASVRTVATKPLLNLEVFGPSKVMKGENVTFKIKVSNPGSGAAGGVVLTEKVPEGLKHSAGQELELEIGTLKPGENRELELTLVADEAGPITNIVTAQADANLHVEARTDLEVLAPALQVSMTGPKRRYLERNAVHNISIANPGTASAKDIELVAGLPKELKFVEANNGGQYDAATHSVYWSLEELPPQETGTVTLTTLPQQPGEARFSIKSTAQANLKAEREETLAIEGLAAINFQLSDVNDPIEVGGLTSYEVRVTNQGTKAATNLRLTALVPNQMKPVAAEGPVRYRIEGQRVVFEPLRQLAAKADTSFVIKVKALEAGDLRVQVQVSSDEIREAITKEESTRVFGDE